jgi:hypothetical protein
MTILIINNKVYEINDELVSVYDKNSGEAISSGLVFNTVFNLPVNSIDAAIDWQDGKVYFFKGDSYYKYDVAAETCDAGYPRPIAGNWKGLWTENIWACVRKESNAYFFAGEEYTRYNCANDSADEGYPLAIAANWKGLPASITGIAMLNDQYALVQNDTDYYRYDFIADECSNSSVSTLAGILQQNGTGTTATENGATASDEDAMQKDAEAVIDTLKAKNKTAANLGGDSAGGKKIRNFPAWFGTLQDMLCQSTQWGDDEEQAQQLLQRYVNYYYNSAGKTMPPNVAVFIRYIGRGEANKNANQKIKATPNAGDLGAITAQDEAAGIGKRYQWCQAASSNAVNIAFSEKGFSFTTGSKYSAKWYEQNPTERIITGKAANSTMLEGGDMFSVVSNKTALSGHVMTAMDDDGTSILAVSGNAGGKAIRVEEVTREVPPAAYIWGNYSDDTKPKQPGVNQPVANGVVWVVSIQKTSLLNHLDSTDASELNKYGLKTTN